MFFKKIETEGLAHFSYIVGDESKAFVIDPRRDVDVYLKIAIDNNLEITHIFETHRNEDFIIGSIELSKKTGATIYISGHEDLGYEYGKEIFDNDEFQIESLKLKALHTPGHTKGHLSYVLYENKRTEPYLVFTGDSLFMGDLGRTDFYGKENLEEMTGLLYDSITEKLFPLGDDTLIFPAHGSGSACGETMEERPYTTIGYEKKYNKALQVDSREEFIKKFGKMRIKPRYFEKMEYFNIKGAPFVNGEIYLKTLKLDELKEDYTFLDIRSKEAFMGGYIPGSYFLNEGNISAFLGTLFEIDENLVLISEKRDGEFLEKIYRQALRKGFDNIVGVLKDGVNSYLSSGKVLEKPETISPENLKDLSGNFTILDIRKPSEIEEKPVELETINIPLEEIYKDYDKLDKNKKIYILCAMGDRSSTAYSFLTNKGFDCVIVKGGVTVLNKI